MTRIEVPALAGQPLSKDIEAYGIALGESGGRTVETWSYVLEGSVGGMFSVSVTFEAGVVVAVRSKQRERL